MNTKPLSFDLIRIDGDTQSRLTVNDDAVQDYADILTAAKPGEWPFPPLDVFYDGTDYFLADGFHRKMGGERAGRASAPCVIHQGTAKDARIFSMTANDRHGLRMSRADKRANVEWLLDNGGKMPQKEIAEKAGVSARLVQMIVAERKPKVTPQQPPPTATNAQIANFPPQSAEPSPLDDFDPSGWPESDKDPFEEPATTAPPPPTSAGNGKPQPHDRGFWYKQWNHSIGPLVRLVDKIANDVGERQGKRHKAVQADLEAATQEMIDWMKVKR